MDDLEGEIFSYTAAAAQDGTVQVTARNEIESPVDVHALDATLTRDGRSVRGLPQGTALPHDGLRPGESVTFQVRPETALDAQSPPEVTFDLSGVTVNADAEAVWNAILDRSTTEYYRLVTVRALPSLFQAPATGSADTKIDAILVEFESGATGELTADTSSAQVRVDYPVDDVVLGRPVDNAYRYTVTVMRHNGVQERDPQPREQHASLFYVSVVR
jgi:hypothetical protein